MCKCVCTGLLYVRASYVRTCIHACAYLYTLTHVLVFTYALTCIHLCTHSYTLTHVLLYTRAQTHLCTFTCIHLCTYLFTLTHKLVYTCTYLYTRMHPRTCIHSCTYLYVLFIPPALGQQQAGVANLVLVCIIYSSCIRATTGWCG